MDNRDQETEDRTNLDETEDRMALDDPLGIAREPVTKDDRIRASRPSLRRCKPSRKSGS